MSFSRNKRLEQAAHWLVRSQDKDFTSDNQKQLSTWLEKDPANCAAFEEMGGVWKQVGTLEHIFASEEECKRSETSVSQYGIKKSTVLNNVFSCIFPGHGRVIMAGAIMVMLALLCLPSLNNYFYFEQPETVYMYTTAAGEQKTVTLSDGSVLEINVGTSLSVHMSKRYRQVEMNDGEVFFQVKSDPDRPFEVRTSSGMVRVLGTAFNVKNRRERVTIDVDHGRVLVKDNPRGPGDMRVKGTTLESGQGVDINASGRLTELRSSDIKQVLAWRQQQAVFKNTPVSEVLHELELYHNINIRLIPEKMEEKGITGTFNMSNLEQTLGVIVTAASLRLEKKADGTITLYRESVFNDN